MNKILLSVMLLSMGSVLAIRPPSHEGVCFGGDGNGGPCTKTVCVDPSFCGGKTPCCHNLAGECDGNGNCVVASVGK
jgi:hypothetical protein